MTDSSPAEFDRYAAAYDASLERGLRLTGAGKAHYAYHRVRLLRDRLRACGVAAVHRVLDFGCGDGDAAPVLREVLGAREVVGVDASSAMLDRARARYPWAQFVLPSELASLGEFDAAYCNGVFHHIPRADRAGALATVYARLRRGGAFGLWENNPWNPGTRLVMSRVEFDRDADLLRPSLTRRLLREAGFQVRRTDYLFVLPIGSGAVRKLERAVSRLPLGGQYQVLATKADTAQ